MDPSAFRAAQKQVSTPFGEIAYLDVGSGPDTLFLHGLPLCGFQWRDVIEELEPSRRCLAPDLMGLGATDVAPDQDVSFLAQAQMLDAFLDALDATNVDVVANDTGAAIAQIFAARHPERARSFTLTNCEVHDCWPNENAKGFLAGMVSGEVPEAMKKMVNDAPLAQQQMAVLAYEDPAKAWPAEVVRLYLEPIVFSPERIALFQRIGDWRRNRDQMMEVAPDLRLSQCPKQIIWGDADVIFDTSPSLTWLKENLGGLRSTTIVPGGKLFFPEERPVMVAEALRKFWANLS